MEINYLRYRPARRTNGYRIAGTKLEMMLKKLNAGSVPVQKEHRDPETDQVSLSGNKDLEGCEGFVGPLHRATMNEKVFNQLNEGDYTQIGEWIQLKGGIVFKESEVPKLDAGSLDTVSARDNVIDFGSARYYRYVDSKGKTQIFYARPGGTLCRPVSEDIREPDGYDRETDRYLRFWNGLGAGHPFYLAPNSPWMLASGGFSDEDLCGYLDEAGISKGFFTVKIGMGKNDFFYSSARANPIYKKEDYDFRYYTMTSPDFSYGKSVFKGFEPGTEITISGKKYALKEDLTLDLPYGVDIFDIQMPKYKRTGGSFGGMDTRA